ncbi:hypothetical protein BBP40_007782 [Aspergillus hancockii]|nr:hypothetical protein BBP40_007782 [Aspergillus hancockii]
MEEIKKVLRECIKLVIVVKDRVMQLCWFFNAISSTIEVVVNHTMADFIQTISESVSANSSSGVHTLKIGNYHLSNLQRSLSPLNTATTVFKTLPRHKVAELSSWVSNSNNVVTIASFKRKEIEDDNRDHFTGVPIRPAR